MIPLPQPARDPCGQITRPRSLAIDLRGRRCGREQRPRPEWTRQRVFRKSSSQQVTKEFWRAASRDNGVACLARYGLPHNRPQESVLLTGSCSRPGAAPKQRLYGAGQCPDESLPIRGSLAVPGAGSSSRPSPLRRSGRRATSGCGRSRSRSRSRRCAWSHPRARSGTGLPGARQVHAEPRR